MLSGSCAAYDFDQVQMAWPQMPHGSATVAQSAWYKAFLRLSACAGLVDPGVCGLYPGVQMTLILVSIL